MDEGTGAEETRSATRLLRELIAQFDERGIIDGSAMHRRLLDIANDEGATQQERDEAALGAVLVENFSEHLRLP